MTTIDQAFIRAYLQQTASDAPTCREASEPARPSCPEPKPADLPKMDFNPVCEVVTGAGAGPMVSALTTLVTDTAFEPVAEPTTAATAEPQVETAEEPAAEIEPDVEPVKEPVAENEPDFELELDAETDTEPAAETTSADEQPAAEPTEGKFQPMLQVDGFAWSERATSLRLAAGIQVDRLADSLTEGLAEGRNVAAIAGCGRFQGCTTMLLCVAKRLADRGLKVALVDADFAHPALAARLGLLPEGGFEAVFSGTTSVADVAIESTGDNMTLLPVAAPAAEQAESHEGLAVQAAAIESLFETHDLVLADVGDVTEKNVPRWADAVVLVRDVRSTAQATVADIVRRTQHEKIAKLGVVENFV